MSAPYYFTPRIPSVPHSTPFSASSYKLSNTKALRPPIHNPYDKFTQPEFDAWIGGITGALKRALGQEDEESESNEHNTSRSQDVIHSRSELQHYGDVDDSEFSDGAVDDSFTEIKARRALGKGKERDPREGPGLGKGNSSQPIEIVSSDEEDAEEAAEVELSMAVLKDSDDDQSLEEEEEQQYEEEYSWERGQSSSQPLPSHDKSSRLKKVVTEEEYGSEEGEEEEYGEGAEYEEFDEEEEYEKEEEEGSTRPVQVASDEIIEIGSDSGDEANEDGLSGEDQSSSPRKLRGVEDDGSHQQEVEEDSDGYDEYDDEEEDEQQFGTSQLLYPRRQMQESQEGQYEDDEGADMADADADADEDEDDEIQEIQPPQNDTSFPPKTYTSADAHVELPDPWSGPRTYAEDYYSGGDIRIPAGAKVDAHHLGPLDAELETALGREASKDANTEQPNEEDTSFPPHDGNAERPVDIADRWEGPRTYAEDFYAGGPVHLPQGTHISAHYIGPIDVDYVEQLDANATPKLGDEQAQPPSENTSFPDETTSDDMPVEIQDPWTGPQTYAEDYYSGGDVRTTPDVPIDPALLSGTGGVEDDIDTFLTPGALTPSQAAEENTEDVFDEGDEEHTGEDGEGTILPPLTNLFVSSSRRSIPAHAEFIAVDDSDDEQEHRLSHAENEHDVEGDFYDMERPLGHREQYQQEQGADSLQADEEASDEFDELDSDVPEALTSSEEQKQPEVSVLDRSCEEEKGEGEMQNSELETNISSEQEYLLALDSTAKQSVGQGHTGTSEEDRQLNSSTMVTDFEAMPETGRQESFTTGSGVPAEKADSTFESSPAEDGEQSHAVSVRGATAAGIQDMDQADSEPPQERTNIEEISRTMDPTEIESAQTFTSGNAVATENDEVPVKDGIAVVPENAPIFETYEPSTGTVTDVEIPLTTVGDKAENNDDDIRSTPGLEDMDDSLISAILATSDLSLPDGQPPAPSSETGRYISLPPNVREVVSAGESPSGPRLESEEVPDEDRVMVEPPQDIIPGLSTRKVSETPQPEDNTTENQVPGLNIVDDNTFLDADADGEIDDESGLDDIEVKSVGGEGELVSEETFIVEESITEGRLTVEPTDRGMSLDVVSVISQEDADDQNDADARVDSNRRSLYAEPDGKTTSEPVIEPEGTSSVAEVHSTLDLENAAATTSGTDAQLSQLPDIPTLIVADPGVPGPLVRLDNGNHLSETTPIANDANALDELSSGSGAFATGSKAYLSTAADVNAVDSTGHRVSSFEDPSFDVANPSTRSPTQQSAEELNTSPISDSDTSRSMTELHENLSTSSSTPVDGLFTPAEPVANSTEHDLESRQILDQMAERVYDFLTPNAPVSSTPEDSSSRASHLPESLSKTSLPLEPATHPSASGDDEAPADDVSSQVPSDVVDEAATASSLPHRAPSVSMKMTLTRKPTDPILMADPYPYCLSTPDPSTYSDQHGALDEGIAFENSQPSISTIKESTDNDASSVVDDGEELTLQYPPDSRSLPRQEMVQDVSTENKSLTVNVVHGQIANIDKETSLASSYSSNASSITGSSTTKRKRGHTPEPSQEASTPPKPLKTKSRKGIKAERKGKGQAIKTVIPDATSEETILVKPRQIGKNVESTNRAPSVASVQESQISSGASAAHKLLQPGSRSSSVSSIVPDNRLVANQPSPTAVKPNILFLPPTVNLESLFHAHGQKKKALALAAQHSFSPRSQSKRLQLSRFPSTSTIPDLPSPTSSTTAPTMFSPTLPPTNSDTPAVKPGTPGTVNPNTPGTVKTDTPIAKPDAPAKTTTTPSRSNFTTPVTRSHCRYHRISLPKEEGGTRINFLVPGCSLNDRELMEEEEIMDHGDATVDDSRNMLKDIENLGFSLDLIGIIRQLVGLDILREQEVFYLPQPGEIVTWKKPPLQKSASEKAAMVRAPGEASSQAGSPGGYSGPGITVPVSNRHPLSRSSFSSTPSMDSAYIRGSAPTNKPDQSDDDEPVVKRSRPSPDESSEIGAPESQSKGRVLKNRRSKKLDLNYEPGEDDAGEESDNEIVSSRKRRKSTRGVKRSRPSEIIPIGDKDGERESKKLKSDSANPPEPKPHTELKTAPIQIASEPSVT